MINLEYIELKGEKYPIAFNINTIDVLQERHNCSFAEFMRILETDRIKQVRLFRSLLEIMINEGIQIENEITGTNKKLLTQRQVGALVDIGGLQEIFTQVETYVFSTLPTSDNNTPSK